MKNLIKLLSILILLTSVSCTSRVVLVHRHRGHLPPGQAKKISGSQSAKEYAPGHQKKKN